MTEVGAIAARAELVIKVIAANRTVNNKILIIFILITWFLSSGIGPPSKPAAWS